MHGDDSPNIKTQLIIGALKFAEFPDHMSIDYDRSYIHKKISQFWLVESSVINPKQCHFVLSQRKFVLLHFGGKKPSPEKQIWRSMLGKLRKHFVQIWSEFYFDIASKMSDN